MSTNKGRVLGIFLLIIYSCNSGNKSDEMATKNADSTAKQLKDSLRKILFDTTGSQFMASTTNVDTKTLVRTTILHEFSSDTSKMQPDDRRFIFQEQDLNGDGKNEIFVGFIGPYYCGDDGCAMFLLNHQGKVITWFSVTSYPVIVSSARTRGWNDLVIDSKGINYLIKWDGKKYPADPPTQPQYKDSLSGDAIRVLDYEKVPFPWFSY